MSDKPHDVVICGGGVIGLCTAYFLAKRGVLSTVIEKNEIASAASGKAGGFLARDWNQDSAQNNFSKLSFDLHSELAEELKGQEKYGYRRLTSYSVTLKDSQDPKSTKEDLPGWLNGSLVTGPLIKIGTTCTTAQVHPYQFCQTLQNICSEMGVKFLTKTEVTDIECVNDSTKIVRINDKEELFANVVVIAMGPWSGKAKKWIPSVPTVFYGQKAHAITMVPQVPVTADAIFTSYENRSPDIYPRPDGEVYSCGMIESPKPSCDLKDAGALTVTPGSCETLKAILDKTSSNLCDSNMTSKCACYIPVTQDGLPLIGNLSKCDKVFIAAGHGCWGILNSPITGLILSQLIIDDYCSVIDITPFDPNRFPD